MPPTETSILSNFLLPAAPLPNILTLRQFTDLFPRAHQSNPAIPLLYRELQHQRAIDTDDVRRNIAAEAKRGERQKREVARARRRSEKAEYESLTGAQQTDVRMEQELFGRTGNAPGAKPHTLESMLRDMDEAGKSIEEEIEELEEESQAVLADIKTIVGDLSDLKYGRFSKPAAGGEELGPETVETLKQLRAVCQEIDTE
ncbi:uncharacterized protein K452DRAFT_287995 [Aplosporella prunicola CBS 121167]|uniref:Cnl2/NKP2 family protein n=1 Tax=Aplosporella prunicola CBS 121167 TaxID=1176127 RepID=A0A6A6BD45_9PEZI|nr:uncharacterized protein K452DRAFT_287995 [Aplosporella prunicola CBS 121167]KAF2141293.1 hypothetical protein K452DRAFT_287995 [Aplosporella prunicola CBS 121167]